jgi:hypothetical protein
VSLDREAYWPYLSVQHDNRKYSSFLSYSDLCLPGHCLCRRLLLYVITLKDTPTHTQTHALCRTPLNEGSDRRRTRHYITFTGDQHPCPGGFEPAILANKRPQTHALGRAATGIGHKLTLRAKAAVLQLKVDGHTLFSTVLKN